MRTLPDCHGHRISVREHCRGFDIDTGLAEGRMVVVVFAVWELELVKIQIGHFA